MPLANLPEDYFYRRLPRALIDEDVRKVLQAVIGGFQDRICDLRYEANRMETFWAPDATGAYSQCPPDTAGQMTVEVVYIGEVGQRITRVLDADSFTPPADNLAALKEWCARTMEIDQNSILTVAYGTDVLRFIDSNTLQYLVGTIGATLYQTQAVDAATRLEEQRKIVLNYFPRLKIKGTALSFDVLGRSVGFGDVKVTPLWGRLSPRIPDDPGSPLNDDDFAGVPEIVPSEQLPDPAAVYYPHVFDDGVPYEFVSRYLSIDPTTPNYMPDGINGLNPYVRMSVGPGGYSEGIGITASPAPLTATLSQVPVIPYTVLVTVGTATVIDTPDEVGTTGKFSAGGAVSGGIIDYSSGQLSLTVTSTGDPVSVQYQFDAINWPVTELGDQVYTLSGGGPNKKASVALNSVGNNMSLEALAAGDSFNGVQVNFKALFFGGSGTFTQMLISDRLSAIKYRTSYYDLALTIDIEKFERIYGNIPVVDNPDVCRSFPSEDEPSCDIAGSIVGSCTAATGKPLSGGSQGGFHGDIASDRVPAPVETPQINDKKLSEIGIQTAQYLEDVRAATRFPRRQNVGFMVADAAIYAAFRERFDMFVSSGIPQNYSGSATNAPLPIINLIGNASPSYTAIFQVEDATSGSLVQRMVVESDPNDSRILNVLGDKVEGVYDTGSNTFTFNTLTGFAANQRVVARWVPLLTERIQAEPDFAEKEAEDPTLVAYQSRPEDEFESQTLNFLSFFDEYPWRRDPTLAGELVDLNVYQPASPDFKTTQITNILRIFDSDGVHYGVRVDELSTTPPHYRLDPVTVIDVDTPVDYDPGQIALAYDGETVYHAGVFRGVPVAHPLIWDSVHFNSQLVGWIPFNEYPQDNLVVEDHSAYALSDGELSSGAFSRTFAFADREWDDQRGWTLKVTPQPSLAACFVLSKYRGLQSIATFSFWFKPQLGTSLSAQIFFKLGPLTLNFLGGTNEIEAVFENQSYAAGITLTRTVVPGQFNFITVTKDHDEVSLGVGSITTAVTRVTAVGSNLRDFGTSVQFTETFPSVGGAGFTQVLSRQAIIYGEYDVLIGPNPSSLVNYTRVDNIGSSGPTDKVYQAIVQSVGGLTLLKFGDGINGAVVPSGSYMVVVYNVDDTRMTVRSLARTFFLSDLRIWKEVRPYDSLEIVRKPPITPTVIPYSRKTFTDIAGQREYVFKVLESGYIYPTENDVNDYDRERNTAYVRRYNDTAAYAASERFNITGISGGEDLPDIVDIGLEKRGIDSAGRFLYAGTFGPLPGVNELWLSNNVSDQFVGAFGPATIISGPGSVNSGRVLTFTSTGTGTPWPNPLRATNPDQYRIYVAGDAQDGKDVFMLTLESVGSNQIKMAATPTKRAKPPREFSQIVGGPNLPYNAVYTDRGLWNSVSTYVPYDYVYYVPNGKILWFVTYANPTPGVPPLGNPDWVEVADKLDLQYTDEPTDAESRIQTLPDLLSVRQTVFGSVPQFEVYTKPQSNSFSYPDTYMYLRERVILDVKQPDTFYRWVKEGIIVGDVAHRDTAGVLAFNNTEPLLAGIYRLKIDAGNLGLLDTEFTGYDVQITVGVTVPPTVIAGKLMASGSGLSPREITSLDFELTEDILCPWTLSILWTNPREVPEKSQKRDLAIYGYKFVRLSSDLYKVVLSVSDPYPQFEPVNVDSPDVDPLNPNINRTPGGWIGYINSFGTVPVGGWVHESRSFSRSLNPSEISSASKLPISDLLTNETFSRREDLLIPAHKDAVVPVPMAVPIEVFYETFSAYIQGYEVGYAPDGYVSLNYQIDISASSAFSPVLKSVDTLARRSGWLVAYGSALVEFPSPGISPAYYPDVIQSFVAFDFAPVDTPTGVPVYLRKRAYDGIDYGDYDVQKTKLRANAVDTTLVDTLSGWALVSPAAETNPDIYAQNAHYQFVTGTNPSGVGAITFDSSVSQSQWELWNGESFVAFPSGGAMPEFVNSSKARVAFTWNAALSDALYYFEVYRKCTISGVPTTRVSRTGAISTIPASSTQSKNKLVVINGDVIQTGIPQHFEVQFSLLPDFSDPHTFDTSLNQTGWRYWTGLAVNEWNAFPPGGVTYANNKVPSVVFYWDTSNTVESPVNYSDYHVRFRSKSTVYTSPWAVRKVGGLNI